ncbi:MAG: DUF2065 domain-containing protein [Paracoccaceae bacterium]
MTTVLWALGLVLAIEGLVFALLPSRIEEVLSLLARLPAESRRLIGLGALAAGVVLIWLARSLGG